MSTAPDQPSHAEPRFLGDYRLVEPLCEGPITRAWLAEQASVGRTVVVEELRPDSPESREEFVADVRSKASVNHPLVGTVYEAVTSDGHCFFARERLVGPTLAERLESRATLKPIELAPILRKVAEAQLHLETRELATGALDLADVHVDDQGVVRVNNLVVAGAREATASAQDIARLGRYLRPLVAEGHPGSTRTLTLLGWMAGEDPEVPPLTWQKVHAYATQIEGQLAEPLPPVAPQTGPAGTHAGTGSRFGLWLGVIVALSVVAGIVWFTTRPPKPPPRGLPSAIHIPAGEYHSPDGGTLPLLEFWIEAHEVTIGEYAEFLSALELLDPEQRGTYDHEDQPAEKPGHMPADWESLWAAARERGSWNELRMAPDCPVVNVDWWDAYAYCEWRRGRLPSQEEWFAALTLNGTDPASLEPGGWGPVASHPADRTPTGIHDLAGSVAEWTRRPAANPTLPMDGKKPVIVGASHLRPERGARLREWTDDRSLRRTDLGFRLAFDYQPE